MPGMRVPVFLGNTFNDYETKNINTEDQEVTLRSGEIVPILTGTHKSPRSKPNREAVCACPRGGNTRLTLAHKAHIAPGTLAHVQVRGDFMGHGFIRGKGTLYPTYGVHLAEGPAVFTPGKTQTVQIMNPTKRPLRLRAGMAIGHVSVFDGICHEVTPEEMEALEQEAMKPLAPVEPTPTPDIDLGNVPDGLRGKLVALLERYKSLWDGTLGTIKETEHRIQLKPGATPVRQHPYKTGPRTRAVEEEQVQMMDKLGVIEPANG